MSVASAEPRILAGKYELGETIGNGGMGTVYRATHLVLRTPVAVKLLATAGDPNLGERFLREARVAAAARHPNVVSVLDFGITDEGQPFMVMEYLEGRSLAEYIELGPALDVRTRVELIIQLLTGLEAVHRAGLVHRDVKPANVFVTPLGDGALFARLLDFGISFSVDPDSALRRGRFGTDQRLVIGTPEYMSPEQAEGRPDIDVRTDVYSVGVILYELLSDGAIPFADPHPGGVMFKVIKGEHVPLSELRPELGPIAEVVERAMRHDRELRTPTARQLRYDLQVAIGVRDSQRFSREITGPLPLPPRAGPEALTLARGAPSLPVPAPPRRGRYLAAAVVALGVLAAGSVIGWSMGVPVEETAAVDAPLPVASSVPPPEALSVPTSPSFGPDAGDPAVAGAAGPAPSIEPTSEVEAPAPPASSATERRHRRTRRERRGRTEVLRELDF